MKRYHVPETSGVGPTEQHKLFPCEAFQQIRLFHLRRLKNSLIPTGSIHRRPDGFSYAKGPLHPPDHLPGRRRVLLPQETREIHVSRRSPVVLYGKRE